MFTLNLVASFPLLKTKPEILEFSIYDKDEHFHYATPNAI